MKKLFMMAAVVGLLASCGGNKEANADANAQDSVDVAVPAIVYEGSTKAVEGDKNEIEISVSLADGTQEGTYEYVTTYTYGQTGQQARTGHQGTITVEEGLLAKEKQYADAQVWKFQKKDSDRILYFLPQGDSALVELGVNNKDEIFVPKNILECTFTKKK